MKRKRLERAARQAIVLAAELDARLPAWCDVRAEDLFAVMWPAAVRLERLERRARRNRKGAKAYRKAVREARREVDMLMSTHDGMPAAAAALCRSVPLNPGHWRVGLVPGTPVPAPEREAA